MQVSNQSNQISGTGLSTVLISWGSIPPLPDYALLILSVDDGTGNIYMDTLKVFECCDLVADEHLNNHTINNSIVYTLPNNTFNINGELIIDNATVEFDFTGSGSISFGPMSKISLINGSHLIIRGCTLYAGCDYMWDGIFLSDESSVIIESCTIKDAIGAIHACSGAGVHIESSSFINNYQSLIMHNYVQGMSSPPGYSGNAWPLWLYGSSFSQPGYPSAPLPLPPYDNQFTYCGVFVADMDTCIIGVAGSALGQNSFTNMPFGIIGKNCDVRIYNNEFEQIGIPQLETNPVESGIYLRKDYGFPDYICEAIIGENLIEK